ncbi:hypothetical protein B7755_034405 [Streptomyces sp. NBS 14/10]|uniref:hypothetical protein n=1 Tax=Streptomyces sp. NBS 14/10 TaxID=1945643 RepID=UPI00117BEAB1|nr:hypothetical protein [Streptomyces sp. NBS 14/10]KAK1182783.1 hypothetical protein B7755_034405 [Streptomyces sp. NBS 14/10]
MDALTVKIHKWDVFYFPANTPIDNRGKIGNFDELEDRLLAGHPRMRRILVQLSPNWPLGLYYLHWGNGSDLSELDFRVAAGVAREADFEGAVVGEAKGTSCFECHTRMRIIGLEPGLALFSNDLERIRAHEYRQHCPVCGKRWTSNALEFIDTKYWDAPS